jgi:hypothetical protein
MELSKLPSSVLKDWLNGEDFDNAPFFVIVKTQVCGKCESFLKKENIFKKKDWFNTFVFNPQDSLGVEILQNIGITSVPFILYRYKDSDEWKTGTIIPDVEDGFINTENIFDALYSKDNKYFGYDDYDEPIDSDADYPMIRLLHQIYGEIDDQIKRDHEKLRKTITN